MPLIDLATARDACNLQTGDTDKDPWLMRAIDSASEVVEYHAGRAAGPRTVTLNGGRAALLLPDAATAVTAVEVGGVATTDYSADLGAGILYRGTGSACGTLPFPSGVGNVEVTYAVAEAAPASKAAACTELVRVWFQGSQQGQRPAFGGDGAPETLAAYAIPANVMRLLAPSAPSRMPGIA